ncbi:MAG: FmdB family zinc ribbon protein [Marmoricola sp.]
MPTYQYSCTECDHFFEQFQAFSDDALTECPSCGGRLRKVFNAVGVVFKGSGFYRNDSRAPVNAEGGSTKTTEKTERSSESPGSESSGSESSGSESSGSGSSDSTSSGSGSSESSGSGSGSKKSSGSSGNGASGNGGSNGSSGKRSDKSASGTAAKGS